ncbi:hypothetical protein [Spongiactinospora sp. TRM90649]|uniref:hypothetical protein n=1 Tax=Spongiactinospora sp. TRM90649 TaxID=3031114 RepID=UPI0023F71F25|nr:hypothetical protein [Spongiactinospora sp. TRM90649]MDF5759044.1 hypothetical protein [Spongiactinospora sp. TRM90649]
MFTGGMTRLLVAGLAFLPAGNDDGDGVGVSAQSFNYLVWARKNQLPRSSTPAAKATRPQRACVYKDWLTSEPQSTEPTGSKYYQIECSDGSQDIAWNGTGDLIWIRPNAEPPASPEKLARRAYKLIPITPPSVLTAPPRGRDGVVGLPHWFWLTGGQWAAKSKRVHAGGVWAEATATPQRMTITTGDGRTLTCDGPGITYTDALPTDRQRSSCSHRYQRPADTYQVTVSVTWSGTWHGSRGTSGTLPPITRSSTFPVRVVEAQALVTKG